jgi:hypothetical protein
MPKAKITREIKVRVILEVFKQLEKNAIENAQLLASIRKEISYLDLDQTIPVKRQGVGCHDMFLY